MKKRVGKNRTFDAVKAIKSKVKKENHRTKTVRWFWQGHKDLNPEPTVLETAALPIELYPYIWWAFGDSNPGPTGYEPAALTN